MAWQLQWPLDFVENETHFKSDIVKSGYLLRFSSRPLEENISGSVEMVRLIRYSACEFLEVGRKMGVKSRSNASLTPHIIKVVIVK